MKPWSQINDIDKELIRSQDEHMLMALKIGERAEEVVDAALERLGFTL